MRVPLCIVSACLVVAAAEIAAGPARMPLKGTPLIAGKEVPRFVLVAPIDIRHSAPGLTKLDLLDRVQGRVRPGQFIPVSEDAKGIYYQAANGIQPLGSTSARPGGLYVSKTRAERVFAYMGDARVEGAALIVDIQSIATGELRKLKVGRPAG